MIDAVEMLRTARTVVLHDWPSEDVPNALVAAGLDVTFQGGPEPDDLYVTRLVDGRPETERVSGLPEEEVTRFFAVGMLMNVMASMDLWESPETWSQRLLAGCKEET